MFCIRKCAVVYLQMIMREGEGACPDDRRIFTTYPGRLIACQSSPHLTRMGVMLFASLSISWSHCAQIKEWLQSQSRKRELKGLLSLSTSPSFLVSRHLFKQPWMAECWAKRRLSRPSCTLFTSSFTLFCKKTAFRRLRWREKLEWSGLLRPQRKEAPFHPLVVFVRLSLHSGAVHRAHRPLLPIFKYINNKKTWIWEEDEISPPFPPQGGIFCLFFPGWKVTSYILV